ncbi:MAG TPA: TrkA family potassium uptake protein [Phycisphaerae bacterium]|nr:TrkA family potassium uptake protein [Phycisphaerae bacterium]
MYMIIAGAGLVGSALARRLIDMGHDVVVIEMDKVVCEQLAAQTGAMVFQGSATDISVLEQAGAMKADVAVGTMQRDADNLAFSLLAKSYKIPRVIARLRDQRYEAAYKQAGVNTTIHIADVFVNQLILEIEDPHLQRVATFGGGRASIVVDTIPEGSAAHSLTVSQVATAESFPDKCIITGIYRPDTEEFLIPRGSAELLVGDRVFLVAEQPDLRKASKYLHKKSKG